MLEELGVLERQHKIAVAHGDVGAIRDLAILLGGLEGLAQSVEHH